MKKPRGLTTTGFFAHQCHSGGSGTHDIRAKESVHSMKNYKRPESVLVVVHTPMVDKDGQVLVLERVHPEGFWQSVTGSLEWDEAPLQAAQRELFEETGLKGEGLVDQESTARFEITPPWRPKYEPGVTQNREHHFTLCLPEAVDIQVSPEEHLGYEWLDWREARERVFSWTNQLLISRIFGDHAYIPSTMPKGGVGAEFKAD